MEFKTGTFQALRATTKIHLGALSVDILEGQVIHFDGTTLKLGGKEHNLPSLAAAAKQGWLVVEKDQTTKYKPQPAGVQVRPAADAGKEKGAPMTMGAASEDEVLVGTLEQSTTRRKEALDNSRTISTPAPTPKATKSSKKAAKSPVKPLEAGDNIPTKQGGVSVTVTTPAPKEIKYPLVSENEDGQVLREFDAKDSKESPSAEGISIGQIKTPARQKTVLTDAAEAQRAIQHLDSTPPPKATIKIKKSAAVAEGEDIKTHHPGGASGDVASMQVGDELSDLLPDAATSGLPRPGQVVQGDDGVTRLAWDTSGHWRTRVREAVAKHGNDMNALRQIYEVESAEVVKHIKAAVAKAKK